MIVATNIHKNIGDVSILKGVDITIKQGETISIVGSSGAGKTTLLQVLSTLDTPSKGVVNYEGVNTSIMTTKQLAEFRNKNIGFIFQFHHLLAEFNALENVCMPAFIRGDSKKQAEDRGKYLLEKLDLSKRLTHKPSQLSGGEQQRVATARALMNEPKVVFADEPSGNLDSTNAEILHKLFFRLAEELKQTFVIVTHDTQLANLCDKKYHMSDGKI